MAAGFTGSGPYVKPGEDRVVPSYDTFLAQVKIDQVLKGVVSTDKILWVSYTALVMVNGKDMYVVDLKAPKGSPSNPVLFNVKSGAPDEVDLPGSPHKGVKYVFFLENRKVREPGSYEAAGKEEIIFQNFDFKQGMVAANPDCCFAGGQVDCRKNKSSPALPIP